VKTVPGRDEDFDQEILDGKVLATRKNPHVTSAGLRPRYLLSYWCFMLMETSTIQNNEI
jgi:hypothetical protein